MMGRLLVILLGLTLNVQVVRNAAVDALSAKSPQAAERFWKGHPDAELAIGMTQIGRAAHDRQPVGSNIFALIDDASRKAPLAPEPFLVHGVRDELAGKTERARQEFLAAELRDPRSLPARYFLADLFYRSGDPRRTLEQIATLARLTPNGRDTLAPYLAAYASDRSIWPYLRALFRSDPYLEGSALVALAGNAANADAVVALSTPGHGSAKAWAPVLVNSLIGAGQYAKARQVWAETSNVRSAAGTAIYDAAFSDKESPPPFNWQLVSSTVGLAERQPGGRLHVIFYGQEDGVLARELVLLPAGAYRLSMSVAGDPPRRRALRWSVRCDRSDKPFAEIGLDQVANGSLTFTVPNQCGAQWLELSGASSDVAQQLDFTISDVRLERANG